ncbi:hypothetical protein [Helcococcus ovis]|uniref:hypothetical protein n=1 Tax=Helcococcus ovis TaxID=72026 RepID=UPI0038B8CD66
MFYTVIKTVVLWQKMNLDWNIFKSQFEDALTKLFGFAYFEVVILETISSRKIKEILAKIITRDGINIKLG